MRQPYRPLTKWQRRVRAFRLWIYEGADEKVIGACLLFLVACEIWWIW